MTNFLKSFSIFGSFTLISRLFGFIRDVILARVLGAGLLSDAFFIAFRLPNLFRSLFAEGAMNSAFIPIYSKKLANGDADAPHFIGKILFLFGIFLIIFCIVAEIFMPFLLMAIAPGFDHHHEYFQIGVMLGRIMFPFLFLIGYTAILGCALQSHHKFMPTSAYPIIMNIVLIFASFIPYIMPAYTFAYAIIVSGVLQLIFLISCIYYYKISIQLPAENFFNPDIKHFFRKLIPSILTCCITRIGITIDTMIASTSVGAVSYIYYADRLYQLPLALIGTTLSSVLLPSLSKMTTRIQETQVKIIEFAMILILPATIGLFLMSEDICALLFGSTKFTLANLKETSSFLGILCLALPANILNAILNSILFSHHITKYATKVAIYSLIVNVTANFILFWKFGYKSVAIATVISSYLNTILLALFCKKQGFIEPIKNISNLKYIFFTNMILSIIIEILNVLKDVFLVKFSLQWKISIVLEIFIVAIVYFLILNYKKRFSINDFKKLFID